MEDYVMSNVIKFAEKKAVEQYSTFYSQKCSNYDLRLDDVIVPRKERDIRKEMIKGYLSLLSNQK